ncbi:DNA replication complex GINS family protein [Candidatus Woesearchaeota archaeon]|nr:DNA replication complex GINS family protein [Candidatus Woesearchaeota archaeon]
MNEVKITYETLFDLLRREKDREELQELDETFYSDVLVYLNQKQSMLEKNGAQSGLFGASEEEKTRIQIQNIKKIVKELYEVRERKIIRIAVNKSKTGSTLTNTTAMLPTEKTFFNEVLEVLNSNRDSVLKNVLFFENGEIRVTPKPAPVDEKKEDEPPKEEVSEEVEKEEEEKEEPETEPVEKEEEVKQEEAGDDYDEKVKVKFTGEVPKFLGKKLEVYGPFKEGDEAEVPRIIANILINKGKVEEIKE